MAEPGGPGRHPPRPLEGVTVLVVEDDPDGAELLRQMTVAAGAWPLVARDALDGLSQLRARPVQVVLSDLRMPWMDGYEFVAAMRRHQRRGRIPVVAVTAYGLDTEYVSAWAGDFDAHLAKPVEYEALVATIQRVLTPRRRRRPPRGPARRPGPASAGGV